VPNTGIIKNWRFVPDNFNPNQFRVIGIVVEHNSGALHEGGDIHTNQVTAVERTETEIVDSDMDIPPMGPVDFNVTTRSGSKYRLQGLPDASWVSQLAEQGTTVSRFMADQF